MKIEIVQKNKQSLFAYKDGNLLFYSILKYNWTSRIVQIYNHNDNLVLELKFRSFFIKSTYKILFQDQLLTSFITDINGRSVIFDHDKCLTLKPKYYISFNYNYYYREAEIAQLKKKILSFSSKMVLDIKDKNLEFLDQIIIHVLSIETGASID